MELSAIRFLDPVKQFMTLFGTRHDATLSDRSSWTVTAAVKRPMQPPRFTERSSGGLALSFTRLKSSGAQKAWDEMMSTGKLPLQPMQEPEGSIAFLQGELALHRRSTQSLRTELMWHDFDDSICLQKKKDGTWEHRVRTRIEEQTLVVSVDEKIADQPVDVAVESWHQGKPVQFDVGTRAVRVGVRVVAKSRFENCFQRPDGETGELSSFEAESCPRAALLTEAGQASDRSMWIPSTVRPPVPEVSRVELLYRPREVARSRSQVILESGWKVRVRLKQGTWYMSGEGEMLGVVLMPHDLVETSTERPAIHHALSEKELLRSPEQRRLNLVQEYPLASRSRDFAVSATTPPASAAASDTKPRSTPIDEVLLRRRMQLQALASGWGTDPSAESGKLDATLSASNFGGWSAKAANLPLPFKLESALGGDSEVEAQVAVLAYTPVLDTATGERVVDIDMLMPEIDGPFVRLSLVRYQPHAMHSVVPAPANESGKKKADDKVIDVSLSSQRLLDPMVIPATRRVEVNFSGNKVIVKVTGAAHQRRSPGLPLKLNTDDGRKFLESKRHITDVPWMRMALQQNDGRGPFLGDGFERTVPAQINGNQGIWRAEFEVEGLGRDIMLFIEETVHGISSELPAAGTAEPRLVELPRGFKCDIPLTLPAASTPNVKELP
jgi:hypothetical protein